MVAARVPGIHKFIFFFAASTKEIGGESIEATEECRVARRLRCRQGVLPEGRQDMADERGGNDDLIIVGTFSKSLTSPSAIPQAQPFRRPSLRSGLLKGWAWGCSPQHPCNHRNIPGLLTTETVLVLARPTTLPMTILNGKFSISGRQSTPISFSGLKMGPLKIAKGWMPPLNPGRPPFNSAIRESAIRNPQ